MRLTPQSKPRYVAWLRTRRAARALRLCWALGCLSPHRSSQSALPLALFYGILSHTQGSSVLHHRHIGGNEFIVQNYPCHVLYFCDLLYKGSLSCSTGNTGSVEIFQRLIIIIVEKEEIPLNSTRLFHYEIKAINLKQKLN